MQTYLRQAAKPLQSQPFQLLADQTRQQAIGRTDYNIGITIISCANLCGIWLAGLDSNLLIHQSVRADCKVLVIEHINGEKINTETSNIRPPMWHATIRNSTYSSVLYIDLVIQRYIKQRVGEER